MIDLNTVTIVIAILAQTGAIFYWGGQIKRSVDEHERRLGVLEGFYFERAR